VNSSNLGMSILLYIIGIMLVMMAVLILLKGFGLLTTLPNDVIWALVLLAIGFGILSGIRNQKGR